jgi:uncharacterized protein YwgA
MKNLNKVIACFKELRFKPNIEDFSHRIIIQKIVYLLQQKGIQLGFEDYCLNLRGPYSHMLTAEYYDKRKAVEKLETRVKLTRAEAESVRELGQLFETKPNILEIAATYAYFSFEKKENPIAALKELKKLKPFFSETQIAIGTSKAKEFLFKPSRRDLENLRKEVSAWESASINSIGNAG